MTGLLWAVIGIFILIIIILLIKIYSLGKGIREISRSFTQKLSTDTNTLIDVSSRDPRLLELANSLNEQLLQLRRQRRQYLKGDRELKEAVTNISHDLRTPLTAICGYLDLLAREEKSEAVIRYLGFIENRTEALKRLTEELFRYSVILSASEELKLEPTNINEVLEESIAALYGALTERGITPEIHITQRRISGNFNREALCRIFGNLLSNAIKYSDGDLEISLSDSGVISFSNTAAGLDKVQVGKLFDRFFSVEAAGNSTGLGLAISKTLVEQMNGRITARYRGGKLSILIEFTKAEREKNY